MTNSATFRDLRSSIGRLGRNYLSFKSRPIGNYTPRQFSCTAAYTIFCHAEIETFLEEWATKLTDLADTNWQSRQACRPLVHLCTFHEGRGIPSDVPNKDIWNMVIFDSIAKHRRTIKQNNGIKENNIIKLLSPLGFDVRTIDSIFLADISSFGKDRGDLAHNSMRMHIGNVFDPFGVKRKVEMLLLQLSVLDNQITSYYDSC